MDRRKARTRAARHDGSGRPGASSTRRRARARGGRPAYLAVRGSAGPGPLEECTCPGCGSSSCCRGTCTDRPKRPRRRSPGDTRGTRRCSSRRRPCSSSRTSSGSLSASAAFVPASLDAAVASPAPPLEPLEPSEASAWRVAASIPRTALHPRRQRTPRARRRGPRRRGSTRTSRGDAAQRRRTSNAAAGLHACGAVDQSMPPGDEDSSPGARTNTVARLPSARASFRWSNPGSGRCWGLSCSAAQRVVVFALRRERDDAARRPGRRAEPATTIPTMRWLLPPWPRVRARRRTAGDAGLDGGGPRPSAGAVGRRRTAGDSSRAGTLTVRDGCVLRHVDRATGHGLCPGALASTLCGPVSTGMPVPHSADSTTTPSRLTSAPRPAA